MTLFRTSMILALVAGLAACGVKRDLTLPPPEKPEANQSQHSAPME